MAETLTDTHTILFTRIPRVVEKTWRVRTVSSSDGMTSAEKGNKHSEAVIQRVTLTIEYNPDVIQNDSILDETYDLQTSKIDIWQRVQGDYKDLESAVKEALRDITERDYDESNESGMRTVDLLLSSTTRSSDTPELNTAPRYRPTLPRIHESTITPDDSASHIPVGRHSRVRTILDDVTSKGAAKKGKERRKTRTFFY